MTTQFNRDELEVLSFNGETHTERALARMLLAGMGSDPVAYIFKHPSGKLFWALTDESNKGRKDVMPVYAAPPAPVSEDVIMRLAWELVNLGVDEKTRQDKKQLFELVKIGIERARIILKAQEWIKCSERMPPLNNGQMWIYSPTRGVNFMFALAASGEYYDTCDSEEDITDATHWMPISIPAAPEQEV